MKLISITRLLPDEFRCGHCSKVSYFTSKSGSVAFVVMGLVFAVFAVLLKFAAGAPIASKVTFSGLLGVAVFVTLIGLVLFSSALYLKLFGTVEAVD
ncbi:hypothetical protein [Stenotrophobium rhamnosiphilum]|uniref:Uncharacterized protein n=1 Tax=Stenotrophobium rhamnosiphilum TaxID=2029166 RepID=A0A2T5MCB2_9GAMM|nr:hypothetical protein [Stenotrophobium rhamnosiphilum]PTU30224.1 hypothetical protein CJD38_14830 [Stenotrophobium rhamnosiphilum]